LNKEFQFVITAPYGIAPFVSFENSVRQTHGVLIEMFIEARSSIILAAPYLKDFEFSNKNLHEALLSALKRNVSLRILTTTKSVASLSLKIFEAYDVQFLVPKSNLDDENIIGSHAKFCIVDGRSVYLGSANFTYSGLNTHFEMGIYFTGLLAQQVESFWKHLVENEIYVRYL
jgi:phosphatidylserine/phosphatidylglycerophosphate/cardiolipin synthase-like enzyme